MAGTQGLQDTGISYSATYILNGIWSQPVVLHSVSKTAPVSLIEFGFRRWCTLLVPLRHDGARLGHDDRAPVRNILLTELENEEQSPKSMSLFLPSCALCF